MVSASGIRVYLHLYVACKEANAERHVVEQNNQVTAVESLVAEREAARQLKNFQRADELRASLMEAGVVLEDVAEGIRWHRT